MARKSYVNGRIFEETGARKGYVSGQIFEEALSAPPATTAIPPKLQGLNSQFATIIAHRLGGVLEQ